MSLITMTEKEIRKNRNNLKSTIRTQAKNLKDITKVLKETKDKVVEYNNLTQELQKLGYSVFIPLDFLIPEYWEVPDDIMDFLDTHFCQEEKKIAVNPITKENKELKNIAVFRTDRKTEKIEEVKKKPKKKEEPKETPKENTTHSYIITLAWSETDSEGPSKNAIDNIKKYFESMDVKEVDTDFSDMAGRREYMVKYEYIGEDSSFKVIKDSAQFMLDELSATDYDKFNIAIFGKKVS